MHHQRSFRISDPLSGGPSVQALTGAYGIGVAGSAEDTGASAGPLGKQ